MEKVALVTGSSSGIGLETALALARDGYETYASMRDVKKSAELEYAAKKEDLKIKIIQLDVDKEESIVSAIKEISTWQTKQLVISQKNPLRPKITYDNVILVF